MSHRTDDRRASRRLRRRLERRKRYATVPVGRNIVAASPEAVAKAIAALPEDLDWSTLADFVVPLFARRRPLPLDVPPPVQVVLPPGLSVGFGVDIGPAFLSISDRLLERWGIDRSTLVRRALANTERLAGLLEPADVQHAELLEGLPVAALIARVVPASALLLLPKELERLFGRQERLFVAPMRDLLFGLPADVDPATAGWIRDVAAEQDPNAIALEGVRFRDGRLVCEALEAAVAFG